MKQSLIILTFLSFGLLDGPVSSVHFENEWSNFKQTYGKLYNTYYQEQHRKNVFMDNLRFIDQFNRKQNSSFKMGVNQFADMTLEEYREHLQSFQLKQTIITTHPTAKSKSMDLPSEIDWTKRGMVTPVLDQGFLAGSWIFSAVSSMESQHAISVGQLIKLSGQELNDCVNLNQNKSQIDIAFQFAVDNHGIDTEASYPYTSGSDSCRKNEPNKTIGAIFIGYQDLAPNDELVMQGIVANMGPVSTYIDASSRYFQLYKSGVYDHDDCSPNQLDHSVAVVGYGTLNGNKFWKVKNSWGSNWGMDGYILMSRNKDNQCGIASMASYPIAL